MSAPATRRRARRVLDALVVAVFLASLAAPTIDAFARTEDERGPAPEMRRASPMPALPRDMQTLSTFPAAFEAHFGDTFGLRDRLMRLDSLEKHALFATSPSPLILTGRHGWLFWNGDRSGETFRGTAPLGADELAGWQYELEQRARALKEHGCEYLWVIAPNKETIYPENMPDSMRPIGPTRLDQFMQWMSDRSTVDVLDLRPVLRAEKAHDSGPMDAVYSPYGTHWTGRGSVAVYRAIVEHLARRHPLVAPLAPDDIDMRFVPAGSDSLAGNLYLQTLLTTPDLAPAARDPQRFELIEKHDEPPSRLATRASGPGLLPPTLVFHDSFGPFIWPLLASTCQTLDMHGEHFDARLVDTARTRIVIEIFVERVLVTWQPTALAPPEVGDAFGRFRSMPHSLFDTESAPGAGTGVSGMTVERVEADGKPALRFARHTIRQALEFNGIRLPSKGEVCAWIDVDSAAPGLLDVGWRPSGARTFRRRDRATIALEAGHNTRLVWLPSLGGTCDLLLRPHDPDVVMTLRSFGVRSTEAP